MVFTCVTTQGPASMMVQAVCLPVGSKMLVIPIFFPIIPFIFVQFMPAGLLGQPCTCLIELRQVSIPVCHRPFLLLSEASAKATLVIALKARHPPQADVPLIAG